MQISIRSDSVEISGYVNAVERDSNPLRALNGRYFIERICKGAFKKALNRGAFQLRKIIIDLICRL